MPKILGIVATIAVLAVCGWAAWKYIFINNAINPATTEAMENASVCVYGGYYYEINVKDDPFKNVIKDWPDKWYLGIGKNGKLQVNTSSDGLKPISYTGTAFFISKNGEMGTNRHIAVPWENRDAEDEETIRQQMEKARQATSGDLYELLAYNVTSGMISATDANAWLRRYQNSSLEISGRHAFFGVGLTGSKVNNQIDLQQAQVIAESGDPQKDVAIIRLNSRKTPDYIVKMGAIYDITKAVTDEQTLKPLSEELTIVGYPLGETVTNEGFNGQELHPTMHTTKISRVPDDNQIQLQVTGIGGFSGSPVSDSKHRLVGVLCSGFRGTDVTFCCNIKHLVELYNKHRVRE